MDGWVGEIYLFEGQGESILFLLLLFLLHVGDAEAHGVGQVLLHDHFVGTGRAVGWVGGWVVELSLVREEEEKRRRRRRWRRRRRKRTYL